MKLRHEWKHEIDEFQMMNLRPRLNAVMTLDPHAKDGTYLIRSLYFDNLYDKALIEKISGCNMREKFRIRYYNHDTTHITLEKKSKINGLCKKDQAALTFDEADNIARGNIDYVKDNDNPLIKEFYAKMKYDGLLPKTIVDYKREPYIYYPGNTRVTLDYQIRTGLRSTDFLNPDCVTIPAGDNVIILEVKWDEYLPSIIRDIIQMPGARSSAFSKYAQCRIYG